MKKKLLVLFCAFLLFPNLVAAKKVTCSNNDKSAVVEIDKERISIGEIATVTINSETEYEVNYKQSPKDYVEISGNNFKGLKEGKVNINAEIVFMNNESSSSTCRVDLPIEIVSSDSKLKNLNIEEIDISNVFSPDTYLYDIRIPHVYEKVNIIAEANSSGAKITGDGRRYLNDGINEYEIIVTASDGSTSTYKVIIKRAAANDNSYLKDLIVEGYVLSPTFDKNTYKYYLNLDKSIDEINIKAIPDYEYSEVTGDGKIVLASGESTCPIVVKSEAGTETKYEIIVNKTNGTSKLKSLSIKDFLLDKEFNNEVFLYTLQVNSDVTKLDIEAEALYDDDQIEIFGNDELKTGKNDVIIRVTSKDKTSTTYKIVVTKLSEEEQVEIENNNKLLKILLIMFIVSIIIMTTVILLFIKRNYKKIKIKKKSKNKNKLK